MTKDEQARQRLVEIALVAAETPMRHTGLCRGECVIEPVCVAYAARQRAGFHDPKKGSWCAAGLTAAMEDAGLLVPPPGTPARRGAIALLDFVAQRGSVSRTPDAAMAMARPGDIIAWLQHPQQPATAWRYVDGQSHLFLGPSPHSVCTLVMRQRASGPRGQRCSSCVWYTRQGHVAVIVAVDDDSITTVGWNEGPAPGRVMMRRMWRGMAPGCRTCGGHGRRYKPSGICDHCNGEGIEPRSTTVLWRRPGGLYGLARPVAR